MAPIFLGALSGTTEPVPGAGTTGVFGVATLEAPSVADESAGLPGSANLKRRKGRVQEGRGRAFPSRHLRRDEWIALILNVAQNSDPDDSPEDQRKRDDGDRTLEGMAAQAAIDKGQRDKKGNWMIAGITTMPMMALRPGQNFSHSNRGRKYHSGLGRKAVSAGLASGPSRTGKR